MLKDKLMKHLNKKGAKDLDPMEKDAKMGVIGELHKQANAMLHGKVHPAGKVTVASNSKEGLHHGLLKADELLKHSGGEDSVRDHTGTDLPHAEQEEVENDQGHDEHEGSPEEEANESPEEAAAEGDDVSPEDSEHDADLEAEHADKSPEELDEHIQKLTALKHKKSAGLA
jgi:hypothetical protein